MKNVTRFMTIALLATIAYNTVKDPVVIRIEPTLATCTDSLQAEALEHYQNAKHSAQDVFNTMTKSTWIDTPTQSDIYAAWDDITGKGE